MTDAMPDEPGRGPDDPDFDDPLTPDDILARATGKAEVGESQASRLVLLARGSQLRPANPDGLTTEQGQVIIFDDVTVLNQAQREAAWARRS